jgi:hypothetical protein
MFEPASCTRSPLSRPTNAQYIILSFNLLIGWQISIWICCKPFFSLLYNCQLLCSWRLALSTAVEVFSSGFFPDIAPARMFTTNSLCLIICRIYKLRLFFKILKSNLSSFALSNTPPFIILSVHFIFNP